MSNVSESPVVWPIIQDAMKAISVQNVTKRYPVIRGFRELILHPLSRKTVTALDGVTLEVEPGRCFCLLGPNGAGKTTLMKILSTLVLPDEGKTCVNGFDVEREPDMVRASIGFAINEDRSFYWRLTGRQNLEFYASLSGLGSFAGARKVDEVFELTGLGRAAGQRFNTYSTGMRQMMALARALLSDPEILFVDEPTRSLDPRAAKIVRSFLRDELVERQGKTVLWATHNLMEAQELAHDVAIIDSGAIRVAGSVDELTNRGSSPMQEIYDRAVSRETTPEGGLG